MPPIAIVSPSCTVICVLIERLENDVEALDAPSGGGSGALTCWLITMVTTPLVLACARIDSVVPVDWVEIEFANGLLPFCWTPPSTADDVITGTWSPT